MFRAAAFDNHFEGRYIIFSSIVDSTTIYPSTLTVGLTHTPVSACARFPLPMTDQQRVY